MSQYLPTGKNNEVNIKSIVYIRFFDRYILIATDSKLIDKANLTSNILNTIEEQSDFCHINQNTVINIQHIEKFGYGHKRCVKMSNGEILKISRRKHHIFKSYMANREKRDAS